MHPSTRIRICWKINGRLHEEITTKEFFLEHMTQILEETVDRVDAVFYTIGDRTYKVDYYNFDGVEYEH